MEKTPLLTIWTDAGERTLGKLAPGVAGIDQTVGAMFAIIESAQRFSVVRDVARALDGAPGVYEYVRERVKFVRDPNGLERLQAPNAMLRTIRETGSVEGDCDDAAMLVAALVKAQGLRPVLILVARPSRTSPDRFGHVLAGYMVDPAGELTRENVVPMDPQERVPMNVWPRPCRGTDTRCVSKTRIYAWNGGIRW